jgi:uncharacterized membrane protein YhaH (DUF805 family)
MDFNKVWQNFMDTVQNHFMDFNGRVGRARDWYFILACVGVMIVAAIVDAIISRIVFVSVVSALVSLALLLPIGGMSARRMQDVGQNGQLVWVWVIIAGLYQLLNLLMGLSGPFGAVAFLYFFFTIGWLIGLVNLVVSIVVIYFCAQPGVAGDNQYGSPEPVWTPN